MINFPKLYSRTCTGAIQEWQIFVKGDSYFTVSGQIDGQKITSSPTKSKAKNLGKTNETTAENQALLDAQSKFKKKSKTGYFEDVSKIDKLKYIEPTLAKVFADYEDKVVWPVLVQTKYNGGCAIVTKDGVFSRKGEEYISVPHIRNALDSFFERFPDAFLHGELMGAGLAQKLNETMKLIRKTVHVSEEDLKKSKELVRFYLYDGYGFEGTTSETPYLERKRIIDAFVPTYKYLQYVETEVAPNKTVLMEMFDKAIANGDEGLIVRFPDSPYEHKRTKRILKLKPTDDDEFEIIAFEEGDGKRANTIGKVQLRMKDGKTFGANPKGTEEKVREIWNRKEELIGKIVTIYYNGFTGLGTPNYAQFDVENYDKGDR